MYDSLHIGRQAFDHVFQITYCVNIAYCGKLLNRQAEFYDPKIKNFEYINFIAGFNISYN